MAVFFIHGVPNTSAMWTPLIRKLGLADTPVFAPDLPGFGTDWPEHFVPSKEGYADWLLKQIEDAVEASGGPLDLVGHDWGALFTLRVASTRPDLVRSWAVANAVIQPGYTWHTAARRWQTPVIGEVYMAVTLRPLLAAGLKQAGLPANLAQAEARHWDSVMKRSILSLYRSAKTMTSDWHDRLDLLPAKGLVLWGALDPYINVSYARQFCQTRNVPLFVEPGAGHWLIAEKPDVVSEQLKQHWSAA